MSFFYTGRTVLITGGTGFLGSLLCEKLLNLPVRKVISYSRSWDRSETLKRKLSDPRLRTINGDVCNKDELLFAMQEADIVFHCAAYKSVPSAEYNPFEALRVNVDGTKNVIRTALISDAKRVMFISSDKASSPVNLYGRTKALGESLCIAANNLGQTRFSVARYGNVMGSTGSVLPIWLTMLENGAHKLPVTDLKMTRFWFGKNDAAEYVLRCMRKAVGGEVFVPRLKSSTLKSLIYALLKVHPREFTWKEVGARPGEKMHEEMISAEEEHRVVEPVERWTYIIKPLQHDWDANWEVSDETRKGRPKWAPGAFTSEVAERYHEVALQKMIENSTHVL